MSDPLRTDAQQPPAGAEDVERDARIEDLLLSGLDHYFAARYEQAINIWTRVLFLDRAHTRARAYIERARSALGEQLRESEEVLHDGVAAFERGESETARRLLNAVIERSGPNEVALALLARLNRLETGATHALQAPVPAPVRSATAPVGVARRRRGQWIMIVAVAVALVGVAAAMAARWATVSPLVDATLRRSGAPAVLPPKVADDALPVPWPSDILLAQARVLAAGGHLTDSLRLLDRIRMTDPARRDADRLKTDLQRRLLSTVRVDPREPQPVTPAPSPDPE